MNDARRPQVAPPLQLAAYGSTPEHADPTVKLGGVFVQPIEHRGELWQKPSPWPNFRRSVLVHPVVFLSPPPRIGDQTGHQMQMEQQATGREGMPAAEWALRRNYRPTPAIAAGEAEV